VCSAKSLGGRFAKANGKRWPDKEEGGKKTQGVFSGLKGTTKLVEEMALEKGTGNLICWTPAMVKRQQPRIHNRTKPTEGVQPLAGHHQNAKRGG